METLRVSNHLADCAECREDLAVVRSRSPANGVRDALPELRGDATYAEISALLDGELSPEQAEALRGELAAHPYLEAEFTDLSAFRDEVRLLSPRIHGPAQRSPDARTSTRGIPGEIDSKKILSFPTRRWYPLAAAALLIIVAGWWLSAMRHPAFTGDPLIAAAASMRSIQSEALPPDLRAAVLSAVAGKLEAVPTPPMLRPTRGTLAGGSGASPDFGVLTPVGMIVRETRPQLRWSARAGASSYQVYVAPTNGSEAMQSGDIPAPQTAWTPGADFHRGEIYEWQVEARANGSSLDLTPKPPEPEARFQILSESQETRLRAIERRFADDRLILGTAYAAAGLNRDAGIQFHRLAAQFPGSVSARKLSAKFPMSSDQAGP